MISCFTSQYEPQRMLMIPKQTSIPFCPGSTPMACLPNHSKTKLLVLSRSKRAIKFDLSVEGHLIPPSPFVKYLGVTLSADLFWSEHIQSVCKSARRHLGVIHCQLHRAPPKVRHQIYCSTVLPKLDYCCAV